MTRTSRAYSISLTNAIADAVDRSAHKAGLSSSLKIAEIVESHFLKAEDNELPEDAKNDLMLLRDLRDQAIEKMIKIRDEQGFSSDITFKTFQACQDDPRWLKNYETYICGSAIMPGNPRKTNANQTIGSRIKSKLGAVDLMDNSGKVLRGRAQTGALIQTFQLLRLI